MNSKVVIISRVDHCLEYQGQRAPFPDGVCRTRTAPFDSSQRLSPSPEYLYYFRQLCYDGVGIARDTRSSGPSTKPRC